MDATSINVYHGEELIEYRRDFVLKEHVDSEIMCSPIPFVLLNISSSYLQHICLHMSY